VGSIRAGYIRAVSIRAVSTRVGSTRVGSNRVGSIRAGSIRAGSIRVGSIRAGSIRAVSIRAGSKCAPVRQSLAATWHTTYSLIHQGGVWPESASCSARSAHNKTPKNEPAHRGSALFKMKSFDNLPAPRIPVNFLWLLECSGQILKEPRFQSDRVPVPVYRLNSAKVTEMQTTY